MVLAYKTRCVVYVKKDNLKYINWRADGGKRDIIDNWVFSGPLG